MHQWLGSKELKFISYEMQFSYQLSTNENQPVKGTMIHFKSTFIFKMKPLASVFTLGSSPVYFMEQGKEISYQNY